MPRHAPRPDPFYAIRTIRGAWGIVYRVNFTRHGKNVAKLFRSRDFDNASAALKAARAWRDGMTQSLLPETKREFSQRIRPDNTSGCPGVYLKRQIVRRGVTERVRCTQMHVRVLLRLKPPIADRRQCEIAGSQRSDAKWTAPRSASLTLTSARPCSTASHSEPASRSEQRVNRQAGTKRPPYSGGGGKG